MELIFIENICKKIKAIDNALYINIICTSIILYNMAKRIDKQNEDINNLKEEVKKLKAEKKWG